MSKTKTRFGFKSKSQLPLFMIWREWLDNDGEVYDGKVLFTTSHINGKAVVLSALATIAFFLGVVLLCGAGFLLLLGIMFAIGWAFLNPWIVPVVAATIAFFGAIGFLLYAAWLTFNEFYEMFSK